MFVTLFDGRRNTYKCIAVQNNEFDKQSQATACSVHRTKLEGKPSEFKRIEWIVDKHWRGNKNEIYSRNHKMLQFLSNGRAVRHTDYVVGNEKCQIELN